MRKAYVWIVESRNPHKGAHRSMARWGMHGWQIHASRDSASKAIRTERALDRSLRLQLLYQYRAVKYVREVSQ